MTKPAAQQHNQSCAIYASKTLQSAATPAAVVPCKLCFAKSKAVAAAKVANISLKTELSDLRDQLLASQCALAGTNAAKDVFVCAAATCDSVTGAITRYNNEYGDHRGKGAFTLVGEVLAWADASKHAEVRLCHIS
eukprot:708165-Rhodomonas_salina.1